jgi:uncharacterized membrane protein
MTPMTKRLAIALAVSLGLNLLLAGVFVGLRIQRMGHRAAPAPSFVASGRHPERAAPRLRPDGPRHAFRDLRPELKERRQKVSGARAAVRAALEKDPFDKASLEQALEALRKETTESQLLAHQALAKSAADSDLEARRRLASEFDFQRRRPK